MFRILVCWLATVRATSELTNGDGNVKYLLNSEEQRPLARALVAALQEPNFEQEIVFDLKKENQVYVNRTMSLLIKYIVKREVDNYRARRTDAISRRIYSSLIMKLIDIAKDLPKNASALSRIKTAHRYYLSVESKDMHDQLADAQVFHACARLYDILLTAPNILSELGNFHDLTPKTLLSTLHQIQVKPIHLAIALIIQYHLRNTINYALQMNAVEVLSTKPQLVGPPVVEMLMELAARLLPVSELIDIHLAHSSPVFKDSCPSTWLAESDDDQANAFGSQNMYSSEGYAVAFRKVFEDPNCPWGKGFTPLLQEGESSGYAFVYGRRL